MNQVERCDWVAAIQSLDGDAQLWQSISRRAQAYVRRSERGLSMMREIVEAMELPVA